MINDRGIDLVLDVGANAGPFATALRDSGYLGRIVSFEPQRSAFAILESVSAGDAAWDCYRLALGASDSRLDLHVAGNSSSSSLLEMTERHVAGAPESRYVASEVVAVTRLDSMRADIVKPDDAVYLKIDVQGFELEVLRGAEEVLDQVVVVESELSFTTLYEGGAVFAEVLAYLGEHGFDLISLDPVFVDPRTDSLLQADGIFARPQAR